VVAEILQVPLKHTFIKKGSVIAYVRPALCGRTACKMIKYVFN
jgi:hypothetical protein